MSAPRDIADVLGRAWSELLDFEGTIRGAGAILLDALAEAGFVLVQRPVDGSDRVIRWETTTCPECAGTGKRQGSCAACGDRRVLQLGNDVYPCHNCCTPEGEAANCWGCGGSGRGPETVTLHRLVQWSAGTLDDGETGYVFDPYTSKITRSPRPATTFPTYRVVPVDTSVPAATPDPVRCKGTLGEKPWWMSWGQYDPCRCARTEGHEGKHWCEHIDVPPPDDVWDRSVPAESRAAVALPEETP